MSSEVTAKISELIWLSSLSESSNTKSFFLKGLGKWTTTPRDFRSLRGEERFMEVEMKLSSPMRILGIDVGNYWSAFITVWGSRDLNASHSLLSSKILLSRSDSVTGNASKGEGVLFFDEKSFESDSKDLFYDRLKIKVTQPYNIPTDRFGLSMFVVRGTHSTKSKASILDEKGLSNGNSHVKQRNGIENLIAKVGKHVVEPSKKTYLRDLLPSVPPSSSPHWTTLLRNYLNTVTSPMAMSAPSLLKQFLRKNPNISLNNGQKALGESQIKRQLSSLHSPLSKNTVLNPIQDNSNNNNIICKPSEEMISLSPTKEELHRSVRKVLKVSPVNSSPAELLRLFHKVNPNIVLSKREKERIKLDFIKYCSSPKRKRRSESVEVIHQVKKKSRPSYQDDFDPRILKTFSKDELEHNKVLIQTRVYKKDKELPLEGDSVLFVNKGVPVTFYKTGNRIFMEIENEFFRPEVMKDHIVSIFKDYSLDQIYMSESKENKTKLITIRDDFHLCPVCNEVEFRSVRELEVHSWACTGPQFEEKSSLNTEKKSPTPGPSGLQNSSCPICSRKIPMNALIDHVSQCEG
ncbi:uncharacterized protein [Lepeophtheirus salmonis]|uniref:uncharacterized protein n=1 Tax=Lepeophtheirus salmonis TaxID=72036 RepID=UPI001AE6CCFB|nr:uncharacterized protein LOC121114871 [Lepeophtheirus salmonis]